MGKDFKANEVERASRLLQRQIDKTFGRDSSGDSRVEVLLVDRTRYEPFRFEPVLYRHLNLKGEEVEHGQEDADVLEERLRSMQMNLGAASRDLNLELQLDLMRRERMRFARSAAGRKLIAAHKKMAHNVGFGVKGCPVCDGVVAVEFS